MRWQRQLVCMSNYSFLWWDSDFVPVRINVLVGWDTGTDICVRATRVGHPTPPVSEGGGWEGGWQRHSDLTYSTPLHSANISRSVNFTHFHLHCLPRTSRGDLSQDWCWTSEYTLHCKIRTPDIITTTYCFVCFFLSWTELVAECSGWTWYPVSVIQ